MVQTFSTLLSHWPKSPKLTVFHAEPTCFHSMKKEVTLKPNISIPAGKYNEMKGTITRSGLEMVIMQKSQK